MLMKMDLDEMRVAKWCEVAIPPVGTVIDANSENLNLSTKI